MDKVNWLSLEQRFWEKVDIQEDNDACWEWTAVRKKKEYGEFYSKVRNGKHTRAHQISWMLYNEQEDIPDGMLVCHTCDNPSCCNPYHLFLGTIIDNNRDRDKKGRWNSRFLYGREHHQHGENHHSNKLSEDNVVEIRKLIDNGYSQRKLGKMLNVSHSSIGEIARGESWSWL